MTRPALGVTVLALAAFAVVAVCQARRIVADLADGHLTSAPGGRPRRVPCHRTYDAARRVETGERTSPKVEAL